MKGIADHASKEYAFSHFMPYTDLVQPQLLFEADEAIKTPLLPILQIQIYCLTFQIQIQKKRKTNMIQILSLHLKEI